MNKHTPGPWISFNAYKGKILPNFNIETTGGAHIAVIAQRDAAPSNAALIAAAPDMLEALKSTRLMLYAWAEVQKREGWGEHPELERSIAEVNAAIAKAEGRS